MIRSSKENVSRELVDLEELVFGQAVQLHGDARQRYLDRECQRLSLCRKRIETLLKLDQNEDPLLDKKLLNCKLDWIKPVEVGDRVGPYLLETSLGEGGMGRVFLGSQQEPIRRHVAIKIIRNGISSQDVIKRFEAERETLSLFDHPNLAKILDAGVTEDGQPFFAMEWVQGTSITDYCRSNEVPLPTRLRLFADVCAGIHHAHQKGIIHRDIKPSNVMIKVRDGVPTPKVIDFGIAKALNQQAHSQQLKSITQMGGLVGTIEYMSPEQIKSNGQGPDIRSDIYSLGVLLYELLTQTVPTQTNAYGEQGLLDTLEEMLNQETEQPSERLRHRLDNSGEPGSESTRRGLAKSLEGELDWITLKALQKDPELRYQSAIDLQYDILAYLNGDMVAAMAPTYRYRWKKQFAKHRGFYVATIIIFLMMLTATIFSSSQAFRARRAEHRSNDLVNQLRSKSVKLEEALELAEVGRKAQSQRLRMKQAELAFASAIQTALRRPLSVTAFSPPNDESSMTPAQYEFDPAAPQWAGAINNPWIHLSLGAVNMASMMFGSWSQPSIQVAESNPMQFMPGILPTDAPFLPEGFASSFGLGVLIPSNDTTDATLPVYGELPEMSFGDVQPWPQEWLRHSVLPICKDLLREQKKRLGERDPFVADTLAVTAQVLFFLGDLDQSQSLLEQATIIYHRESMQASELYCQLWVVRCRWRQGDARIAQSLYRNIKQRLARFLVPEEPIKTRNSLCLLFDSVSFEMANSSDKPTLGPGPFQLPTESSPGSFN